MKPNYKKYKRTYDKVFKNKIPIFHFFRDLLLRFKFSVARINGYMGIFNSLMLLFIAMSNLEKYGIDINIKQNFIYFVPLIIVFIYIVGYIDYSFFYEADLDYANSKNPYLEKILKDLKEIKGELNEYKRK